MFRRYYHATSILYNMKKQGVQLAKLLNSNNKKKRHLNYYDIMPTAKDLVKSQKEPGKRAIRRVAVLNKLFMKYITDIMSTGTMAVDILGKGIEISKVKMSPDFQTLNVYWMCKGTLNDIETEEILKRAAGPLRHELSTLRLMGEVPLIYFKRDNQEALIYDIDQRLARADFGEDYVPTELGHLLKSEFSLETKLSAEMKAKIKQLEEETLPEEEMLPDMTHTVYSLDHNKIMNRLLAARKKSFDAWNKVDPDYNVISYKASTEKVEEVDHAQQKTELTNFLLQRQILQNNLYKELRNNREEKMAVLKELAEKSAEDEEYYSDDFEEEDDDYYNDDFDDLHSEDTFRHKYEKYDESSDHDR